MTWRENYRQGSFRGAIFHVETIESEFGRRQVTHEYPSLDKPYTEDLGRKYDQFTVDAYLIGDDYQVQRDALIAACRDEIGPGVLVHPYKGEMNVVCRGLRVRESSRDGGMCVVSMTFIEAGDALFPTSVADNFSGVFGAGESLIDAARSSFLDLFDVDSVLEFVREAAQEQLEGFAAFFGLPGLGEIDAALDDAIEFTRDLTRLVENVESILADPLQLFDNISGITRKARKIYAGADTLLARLFDTYSAPYTGSTTTISRRKQAVNYAAISGAIRQVALAEASIEAVQQEYPSYQDAIGARDALAERIDTEGESAVSDDVYMALQSLRTEVVRGVPAADRQLPRLLTYTPPVTLPSLLVAYQLYGDASREAEIVARNNIRHPGFVSGGGALEVLGDGQ